MLRQNLKLGGVILNPRSHIWVCVTLVLTFLYYRPMTTWHNMRPNVTSLHSPIGFDQTWLCLGKPYIAFTCADGNRRLLQRLCGNSCCRCRWRRRRKKSRTHRHHRCDVGVAKRLVSFGNDVVGRHLLLSRRPYVHFRLGLHDDRDHRHGRVGVDGLYRYHRFLLHDDNNNVALPPLFMLYYDGYTNGKYFAIVSRYPAATVAIGEHAEASIATMTTFTSVQRLYNRIILWRNRFG